MRFEFPTVEEGWAFWQRTNPLLIAVGQMLPEGSYERVTEEGARQMREMNRARDGRLVLDSGSLLILAAKVGHRGESRRGRRVSVSSHTQDALRGRS